MAESVRYRQKRRRLQRASRKPAGARSYLLYTLIWLLFAAVILIIFAGEKRTFLWATDGVYQHYASFEYLCDTLSALFGRSSESLSQVAPLNYTIGQGADILTTLNSYDYTDPVSVLCAFLTPLSRLDRYTLMIFVKLWLSGAAFSLYCFARENKDRLAVMLGALSYAFSGAALFIFARHPNYANWLYFLPLLLAGVELFRRKGRKFPLIIFVFLHLLTNYYTFYMNALLTALYVIIVSVCEMLAQRNVKTVKKEIVTDLRLLGLFLIGALLSAVVLLPTAYAFLHNPRVGELTGYRDSMWSYGGEFIRRLSVSALLPRITPGYSAYLGIAPLAVIGFLAVFSQRKKDTALKVISVLLLVLLCVPLAGRIFNGMSYATDRWAYAVVFFFLVIMTEGIPLFKEITGVRKWVIAGLSFGYLVYLFVSFDILSGTIKYAMMGILLACILMFCFVVKKSEILFKLIATVLILVTVTLNICLSFLPSYTDISDDPAQAEYYLGSCSEEFRSTEQYPMLFQATNISLSGVSTPENFFRVECKDRITNVNGVNHVNGTNSFWSLQPKVLSDFYKDMELAAVVQNCNFKGLDARTTLLELAAVKYYAVYRSESHALPYGYAFCEEYSTDEVDIYENTLALPIAYTYDSYITREEYDLLNPVQKQEALRRSAVLEKDVSSLTKVHADTSDIEPIAYEITQLNDVQLTELTMHSLAGGANIRMTADIPENCEVYLRISGAEGQYPEDFGVNAVRESEETGFYLARSGSITTLDYKWHIDRDGIVYNLGYGGAGENTVMIEFTGEGQISYDAIELMIVRMDRYEEDIRRLKDCPFENAYVDSGHITGDITTDRARLLQFSVPYSEGFSATVDGEKAEVLQSDAMYTAILVPAGAHHIELRYQTPYLMIGVIVSAVTAVGLIGYAVICHLLKRRKGKRI